MKARWFVLLAACLLAAPFVHAGEEGPASSGATAAPASTPVPPAASSPDGAPAADPFVGASPISSAARDHCILCRRAKCDGHTTHGCPCDQHPQDLGSCSEAGCASGSFCTYCHGGFGCLSDLAP